MQTTLKIPAIGHPWPEQGGTYCGTVRGLEGQPDHHLILADAKPTERMSWVAGMAWAKTVSADGHTDFDLPTRYESSVLFGNVGELFEPYWHWTSTQGSADNAFDQDFGYGSQYDNGKKDEGRVRAVRRLPINPSVLSLGVTQAEEVAA